MSAGWTPGPWFATHSLTPEGRDFWSIGPKDHPSVEYMTLENDGRLRGNALLTAAAPELYEALDTATRLLIEHGLAEGAIGDDCLAALAKARGEVA